ncbi:CinA family protein [Methylocella sp.]|uniref:CinA family protein n=1 Tax=Methylocella sp. TaxID=1978226 RepID=UPI0035AE35EF
MFDEAMLDEAGRLLELCRSRHLKIATAESCTGGLVAGLLTSIAGSSDVFERGFVTYSNEAKAQSLGVDAALIARHGAVSPDVARAMAKGTLDRSLADLAVSVTGVAGPGGGTAAKPVGLVYFGCARRDGGATTFERRFGERSRHEIRLASVATAIMLLAQFTD